MSDASESNEVPEEVVETPEVVETAEVVTAEETSEEVANESNESEDQQLKRKRDEDDNEAADAKRATVQPEAAAVVVTAAASAVTSSSIISTLSASGDSETISIAPDKVGQIIGTKVSSFIRDLILCFQCRRVLFIFFPLSVLIYYIRSKSLSSTTLSTFQGAVIQDMQTRTGAKIFLNQDFPAGVNRQVSISGTPAQVKAAGDLIKLILEHGPTAIHVNR